MPPWRDEVLGLGDRPELLEDDLLLVGADVVERGDLEHELVDLLGPEELEDLGRELRPEREREDRGLAARRDVLDAAPGSSSRLGSPPRSSATA